MKEDVRATFVLFLGFVAGASAVSWLVLTDPQVRDIYKGKSERMKGAGWSGFAREVSRSIVFELRASFPKLTLGED
jgi:hypothetical protein